MGSPPDPRTRRGRRAGRSEGAPSPAVAGRWGRGRESGPDPTESTVDRLPGARDIARFRVILEPAASLRPDRPSMTMGNGRSAPETGATLRAPSRRPVIGPGQRGDDTPMSAGPRRGRPSAAAAAQLALELPLDLPAMAIQPEWKAQQRLWGHSFHPMCSYLASFPAALTHAFIARYSRPGDVVLDPFSGRGTTPLQACAEGRIGVGNDLNPFAHLLTGFQGRAGHPASGHDPPDRSSVWPGTRRPPTGWTSRERVLADPCRRPSSPRAGSGDRTAARRDRPEPRSRSPSTRTPSPSCSSSGRRSASTTAPTDSWPRRSPGILHGKSASYLSEIMPNTFSMAPALRPRLRRPDRVRVAATGRVRRPRGQARSPLPPAATRRPRASPCSAMRATSRLGSARPCASAAGPIAPGSSSPRRPTCGS